MSLTLSTGEWIALAGVVVGILSVLFGWLNHRRQMPTEPWKLTKLSEDLWELERLQKERVWITFLLNFHGSEVLVVNGAGQPVGHFVKGSKVLLKFQRLVPGTQLTVFSRPVTKKERRSDMVIAPEYLTPEGISGDNWSANLY